MRNPAEGPWDKGSRWDIVEELRLGSAEDVGPELFSYVVGIDVDALGRIWVLDRDGQELRVFRADGSHVRTIGRLGGAPGDPDGRYLGQLEPSIRFARELLFRGDRLYGMTADSLGVTYIVRARLVAPPAPGAR